MIVFRSPAAREACAAAAEQVRASLPMPTEARTVPTPYGETRVLLAGPPEAPPLLLLHGAMASAAHLLGELYPLAQTRRLVGVDVLGQSPHSADARVPLTRADAGAWVGALVEGLGLERPDLLGVSWGGFLASRAAAALPDRFRSLTLLVSTGFVRTPPWPALRRLALPMAGWKLFGHQASLDALVRELFTDTDAGWASWLGLAMRSYKDDLVAPPLPQPGELAPWTGPVLIVAADQDITAPGEALIAGVQAVWPHAEAELLRDTRHSPSTRPEARAALSARIERFLAAPG